MSEFICMNSSLNSCWWIHAGEFMILKSYMNSYVWIHVWIQCYEEYREIMAEFLEMNSHMKSWLNSFILKYSGFSFKFISVRGNVLLIQSNHHSFFAVSSLQALRLLRGCCSVATRRRCCNGKRRVLRTAEQGGPGGPCKHMMDVTGVEISWACLSARNLQVERLWKRSTSRT